MYHTPHYCCVGNKGLSFQHVGRAINNKYGLLVICKMMQHSEFYVKQSGLDQ